MPCPIKTASSSTTLEGRERFVREIFFPDSKKPHLMLLPFSLCSTMIRFTGMFIFANAVCSIFCLISWISLKKKKKKLAGVRGLAKFASWVGYMVLLVFDYFCYCALFAYWGMLQCLFLFKSQVRGGQSLEITYSELPMCQRLQKNVKNFILWMVEGHFFKALSAVLFVYPITCDLYSLSFKSFIYLFLLFEGQK